RCLCLSPLLRPSDHQHLHSFPTRRSSDLFNWQLYQQLMKITTKDDILLANDLDALLPNYLVSKKKKCKLVFDSHEIFSEMPSLRSEEHTSELQSREKLVCRLLLEKKNRTV